MGRRGATPGLLEIESVQLSYPGTGKQVVPAVEHVDLEIHPGERLLLLGPSGCGKSTLLRAIGGFHKTSRGVIKVNHAPVKRPGPDRIFVFQEFDQLLPWKTVRGNIEFALNNVRGGSREDVASRAQAAIDTVHLGHAADKYPHQLSGGMKQRVAIARAFALEPPVLLMDEPFAALDSQTRERMQGELLTLHEQMRQTLVFVTHSISEAINLADRIAVMSKGPRSRVVEIIDLSTTGPPDEGSPEYGEISQRIRRGLEQPGGE